MKTDNLPPSMQIIELTRAAGGNDLQFATAAGFMPIENWTDAASAANLPINADRRKIKKVLRKLQVVVK